MRRMSLGVLVAAFLGGAAVQLVCITTTQAVAQGTQPPADSIRAKEFILVDSGGRERARLQAPDKGTVGLVVLDDAGKPVVDMGIMPDKLRGMKVNDGVLETLHGGGIGIMTLDGKLRFGLGFNADGSGGLVLCDERGEEGAAIGMPAKGGYSIRVANRRGERVWSTP